MKIDVVQAWKDKQYRESLSLDELALLPENPIGAIGLTDEDLGIVARGVAYTYSATATPETCCSEETVTDRTPCCTYHHGNC